MKSPIKSQNLNSVNQNIWIKNIDVKSLSAQDLKDKFWITWLRPFYDGIAKFQKWDKFETTEGWIKENWEIIREWVFNAWNFSEWFSTFERENENEDFVKWWVDSNGNILYEEDFNECSFFEEWYATFKRSNWTQWLISTNWTIVIDGLHSIGLIDENLKIRFVPIKDGFVWEDSSLDIKSLNNWVLIFQNNDNSNSASYNKFWLITNKWEVLIEWLSECEYFDKDFKWLAKAKKNVNSYVSWEWAWYLDIQWKTSEYKIIQPAGGWLDWIKKFEKHNGDIWYLDSNWIEYLKEWDDVTTKNWEIYLKNNWKWFKKDFIK